MSCVKGGKKMSEEDYDFMEDDDDLGDDDLDDDDDSDDDDSD